MDIVDLLRDLNLFKNSVLISLNTVDGINVAKLAKILSQNHDIMAVYDNISKKSLKITKSVIYNKITSMK